MPNLRETIDRLVSALADDILRALRDVPLVDLMALARPGAKPHRLLAADSPKGRERERPAKAARHSKRPRTAPAKRLRKTTAANRPASIVVDEVERFFAERAQRGATSFQVHEHLTAHGFAVADETAAEAIEALAERGAIRDAGFRRTTGKGTAPVYVVASTKSRDGGSSPGAPPAAAERGRIVESM